jgi:aminopeptidase N
MKYFFITSLVVFVLSSNLFASNYRDSIDVQNYKIYLTVQDFSKKYIEATTEISLYPVFDNTSEVCFDLLGLDVKKVLSKSVKIKKWSYNGEVLRIWFKNSVNKNELVKVSVKYSGNPQTDADWGGFYFSSQDAFNIGVGMAAIPHSYGRVWFPCNDIFTDKATFDYIVTVNKRYTAACGGVLTKIDSTSTTKTYYWSQNVEIPTYLASVAISKYDVWSYNYKGIEREIPVQVFAYKGRLDDVKKSLVDLDTAMRIFETLFGPYQFERIGYAQVSFPAGAMEHAENIAMTSYAFNGTTKNETLLYHELSHSWFGNLVTCKTSQDMWLNEGWASYCEALFLENTKGRQKFREYNRLRHFKVLHFAHQYDRGYRSLANMDLNYTYGTTVYKKGADVVHTLRFYMGDSLFFSSVKKYLKDYAFSNASIDDLKNTLSKYSGLNLDDFFDFWVYSKGFPFFEIKNFEAIRDTDFYKVVVRIGQRVVGGENLANSNRVEVFFMDSDFNTAMRVFEFSGNSAVDTFKVPFEPVLVMCDMYERTADATIDKYTFLTKPDEYIFDECLFDVNVKNITDTAFLRVTCNCIEPDKQIPGYMFQQNYYWTIEGIWNNDFEAEGKFYLTTLMDMNFTKLHKPKDIILMYRKNPDAKWQPIDYQYHKDFLTAKLNVGQYAFAIKTYEN